MSCKETDSKHSGFDVSHYDRTGLYSRKNRQSSDCCRLTFDIAIGCIPRKHDSAPVKCLKITGLVTVLAIGIPIALAILTEKKEDCIEACLKGICHCIL